MLKVLMNSPHIIEPFAASVAHAMSADKAVLLNTNVSDAVMEERADGVLRLLPLKVRDRVLQLTQ